MTEIQPILEAHGLVKTYGRVVALDHSEFELYPGEVVGVIGDNGAGKSTLIKCFSGAVVPDRGEILMEGRPVHFQTPNDARAAGIETVYQNLAVCPALDIATNLFLGPTAALGVKESRKVLQLIRDVRDRGPSVILISHNMPHVFEVADRIHIHRLGRRVAVGTPASHTMPEAVAIMTGALKVDEVARPA